MEYVIILILATSLVALTVKFILFRKLAKRQEISEKNLEKVKEELEVNQKILKKSNETLAKKEQAKQELEKNLQKLAEELNRTTINSAKASENYAKLAKALQEASVNQSVLVKKTIDRERQQLEEEYQRASQEGLEQLKEGLKDAQEALSKQLEPLKKEVNDFEIKRANIIEAQKRELELKEQQNFHRIRLTPAAIEDIRYIRSILDRVSKRDVVAKVIWEAYLQTPTKEMLNRIVGSGKKTGIYRITDIATGECYIGQGTDIARRLAEHVKGTLGIQSIADQRIHHAMGKGISIF